MEKSSYLNNIRERRDVNKLVHNNIQERIDINRLIPNDIQERRDINTLKRRKSA